MPDNSSASQTPLAPGELYRIVWPDHSNEHQRTVGYLGQFLRWETRRCQLHGERLGREAIFQKVKATSRRGSLFAVDPGRVTISQEPAG